MWNEEKGRPRKLEFQQNIRLTTHRVPTPLMVIKGRVQYLLALAHLISTHKLASQFLPLALRIMGMGAPTPGYLPSAKAGLLNRNLIRQTKLLLTRTPSPLLHTALP